MVARLNLVVLRFAVLLARVRREQEGQDLIEYALILAVGAVLVLGAFRLLGPKIVGVISSAASSV